MLMSFFVVLSAIQKLGITLINYHEALLRFIVVDLIYPLRIFFFEDFLTIIEIEMILVLLFQIEYFFLIIQDAEIFNVCKMMPHAAIIGMDTLFGACAEGKFYKIADNNALHSLTDKLSIMKIIKASLSLRRFIKQKITMYFNAFDADSIHQIQMTKYEPFARDLKGIVLTAEHKILAFHGYKNLIVSNEKNMVIVRALRYDKRQSLIRENFGISGQRGYLLPV